MVSFREGDYLTDNWRLFRVVKIVPTRLGRRAAVLEDCRTLEAMLLRPRELRRMQLQAVRPPAVRASSSRRTSVIDRSPTRSAPRTTSARRTSV